MRQFYKIFSVLYQIEACYVVLLMCGGIFYWIIFLKRCRMSHLCVITENNAYCLLGVGTVRRNQTLVHTAAGKTFPRDQGGGGWC